MPFHQVNRERASPAPHPILPPSDMWRGKALERDRRSLFNFQNSHYSQILTHKLSNNWLRSDFVPSAGLNGGQRREVTRELGPDADLGGRVPRGAAWAQPGKGRNSDRQTPPTSHG